MTRPFSLYLDPGLRNCGAALFEGDVLFRAWLSKNPNKTTRGAAAWEAMAEALLKDWLTRAPRRGRLLYTFVSEVPQVYRGGGKGDPDDLLQLAGVVGACATAIPSPRRSVYYPREWKGRVPKDVHQRRILKKLSTAERSNIEDAGSLTHNTVDAVGIGLFHLGR